VIRREGVRATNNLNPVTQLMEAFTAFGAKVNQESITFGYYLQIINCFTVNCLSGLLVTRNITYLQ